MILNFAACFRRPRYRIFLNLRRTFTTVKTCYTLARTDDLSCSFFLALYCPLLQSFRICLGRRLILYLIFFPDLLRTMASLHFSAPTYPLSPFTVSSSPCKSLDVIAEIPSVALLGLAGLRIALLFLVLRG